MLYVKETTGCFPFPGCIAASSKWVLLCGSYLCPVERTSLYWWSLSTFGRLPAFSGRSYLEFCLSFGYLALYAWAKVFLPFPSDLCFFSFAYERAWIWSFSSLISASSAFLRAAIFIYLSISGSCTASICPYFLASAASLTILSLIYYWTFALTFYSFLANLCAFSINFYFLLFCFSIYAIVWALDWTFWLRFLIRPCSSSISCLCLISIVSSVSTSILIWVNFSLTSSNYFFSLLILSVKYFSFSSPNRSLPILESINFLSFGSFSLLED